MDEKNKNTLIAGVVSTIVVGLVMILGTKFMNLSMDMGELLGTSNPMIVMPYFMGWILHLIVGIAFAYIFVALLSKIPGSSNLNKGLLFGFIIFLIAQIIVMPIMGLGFFTGFAMMAIIGSLIGHLIFGGILGYMIKN